MHPTITLTWREVQHAALDGAIRYVNVLQNGWTDRRAQCGLWLRWGTNIEGAAGEIALAQFIGANWAGMREHGAPDVGDGLQIRTVDHPDKRLTVYGDASDADAYVLVEGAAPTYTLVGWLYAHEAKRACWLERLKPESSPAYFVPRGALRSVEDLVLKI